MRKKLTILTFFIALCTLGFGQGMHWTQIHEMDNSMSLAAVVKIGGELQASSDIELAAFKGDVCRGTVKLTHVQMPNHNIDGYFAYLSIDGAVGENFTFKLYDHNASEEYSLSNTVLEFNPDNSTSPFNPFEVEFIGGAGTYQDPYLIGNLDELNTFLNSVNVGNKFDGEFIKLTADIDLATATRSAVTNWEPIGTSENPFQGTFDGNGKTIKNLNIVETEASEGKAYIGFFGYAKNATIKNVVFENVNLDIACLDIEHSQGHIGAVAGSLEGTSTIEDVTVKGDITVEATFDANGASRVAVVAGGNSYGNVTMKNVHVIADEGSYLKANNNLGALAGQLQGKSVFENCSSNIDVTGKKFFAGGIIGLAAGDQTFTNCHTTGDVTITAGREGRANDHYRVGGIAGGWADNKDKDCTLTNCTYTGTVSGTNADGSVAKILDYAGYVGRGYTLNNLAGSTVVIDGVEYVQAFDDVHGLYKIDGVLTLNTADHLKNFATKVNGGNLFIGETIKLGDNIDLNNEEWTPIGNNTNKFQGYFDGNNKTISNLKVTGNTHYKGFFGYIKGTGMSATTTPSVKDLTLDGVNVNVEGDGYYVGGLAGQAFTCNITNVTVKGNVSGVRYVGGLVGHVYTYFKDCHFIGNASCSFDALGGIAGAGDCRAYDCSVIGDVTGSNWVGGIVGNGQEGTSAVGCYVKGDVKTSTNYYFGVGGIAGVAGHGYSSSEFKNNYFDGEVYLEGEKVPAMIIGAVNADNESIYTKVEGNSWNTDYYPATTSVYVVGADSVGKDGTTEDWIAAASEDLTQPRNNNLVMLESDLQYIDATSAEDVVIMSFSKVTKEQVEEAVFNNNAEAQIGDVRYASLEEAIAAVKDGETITLLQNVTLETSLVLNVVGNITIDGNGFTISPAEGYTNEQNGFLMLGDSSYGDAEAATRNYTINNVVFDGVKDWSVIRAQGVTLTVNECTITNCTQTNGQSLLRLDYTEATIKNTTATDNNALMFITHNFNGDTSQTKLTVDNCTLQNNTWNKTAAIYYVVGGSCTITNSEFINNVVNCNANGAVIYLGFQENCTVTNNLFQENTVNEATASTRVAGAIFFGYEAEISGNAFVNNAASNVNGPEGIAQDVCTSTYYDCTIDLSGNYWGGEEPKAGVNYHVQHQTGEADFELSNYYNSYEIDENGNVVVKEESLVNINYVANVGKFNYTSLQAAINAAEDGATINILSDIELTAQNAQEMFKPAYNRESYCGIYIPDDKTIVLELNGKTISYVDKYIDVDNVMVLNLGNLTINDNSAEKTGKITYKAEEGETTYSKFYSTIFNCGTLTVNAGTIENTADAYTDVTNAIDNHSRLSHEYGNDCILTVNGGTLTGAYYYAIRQYTHYLEGVKNRVVINDGTINGGVYMQHGDSWYYADPDKNRLNVDCYLTINGGDFNVVEEGIGKICSACNNPDNELWGLEINGGNFEAHVQLRIQRGYYYTNGVSGATTPAETSGTRNAEWLQKNGGFVSGGTFAQIGGDDDHTSNLDLFLTGGFELVNNNDGTYSVQLADYVTFPDGVTAENYKEKFGENTVTTDGVNYYKTMVEALNAIHNTDINVLYCKPGAHVGAMTHGHVCQDLTVYGNGAYVYGGEQEFEVDTYAHTCLGLQEDLTLKVNYLHGAGAWGQRRTENAMNLVFNNCENMSRIYFTGTTGNNNIDLTGCTFTSNTGGNCKLYSNANGTINVTDCEFSNVHLAINLNHKVAGEQIVNITNTTFDGVGCSDYDYAAPVRVLSSVEGATSDVTIDGCAFTNTVANSIGQDADILLDYAISTTVVNVSGTSAKVIVEKEENVNSQEVVVTKEQNATFTNGVMEVAMIDDVKYTSLAAAFAAAQENDVIVLISNVTEEFVISNTANITLDMEGYTLTGAILPSTANVTIENGTINNSNAGCSAIEINAGTLNLNNVNISSARHAVRIDGEVVATIDGGEYNVSAYANNKTRHAVNVSGNAQVTIVDGTFVGPYFDETSDSGSALNVQTGATVTVEGGNFSGGKRNTLSAEGTLVVKGGTYTRQYSDDTTPENFLAPGYVTEQVEENVYTVKRASFEKFYTAAGVETTSDDAAYSLSFTVTDYANNKVSVKIGSKIPVPNSNINLVTPSEVQFEDLTFNVTSVADNGFNGTSFKKVTISEGVETIGNKALYFMSKLTELVLPKTLVSVGEQCIGAYNPNSVPLKSIVCYAEEAPSAFEPTSNASFQTCVEQQTILIVPNAADYTVYSNANGWKFTNILGIGSTKEIAGKDDKYTLLATVTSMNPMECSIKIGNTKPAANSNAELVIPETVTFFEGYKFNVTSIPNNAFSTCYNFTGDLEIPATVKTIGTTAFLQAYYNKLNVGKLTLNEGLVTISNGAFISSYFNNENLVIPTTVTTIGSHAFNATNMSETLTVQNNIPGGFNGFAGSLFTMVVVKEGVTSIVDSSSKGVFSKMSKLETVILPSTLEEIGVAAFSEDPAITTIITSATAQVPAIENTNAFDASVKTNATVWVVGNSYDDVLAYKANAKWNEFANIHLYGAVAQIEEVEYLTIQDAINAAQAGETITVIDNVELTETITVAAGKEVVLDLNGKTVSYTTTEYKGEAMITNNGNLTITDTSDEKTGSLSYAYEGGANSSYGFGNSTIENKGVLTINAGTVENTSEAMSHASYAINTGAGATLNVEGGNILNLNGHAVRMVSFDTELNTVNINGGYIEGTRALQVQLPGSASSTTKPAMDLNITGGELMSNEETYNFAIYVFSNGQSAENVSVEISGGTFNGNVAVNAAATNSMLANAVAITDGTFNGEWGVFSYADNEVAVPVISITGGIFATNYSEFYAADEQYVFEPNENGTYSVVEQTIFTQTINLSEGWNWFSYYVDTDLAELEEALGENGVQINSKTDGFVAYNQQYGWSGLLSSITESQMYMINVRTSHNLELSGELVNTTYITLHHGWNWIGFPVSEAVSVTDALAGFEAKPGDQIKSKDNGFASYNSQYGWGGTLSTLNPGEGYMYQSNNSETTELFYSAGTRGELKANVTTDGNHWIPNAGQYPNNMTMTAMVEVEGGDYEVAAFVNGECRGSARPIYIEALDAHILFLTIHGEDVEEMTFRYYDIATGEDFELNDRINYSNDAIVGTLAEPYIFSRGTTGIGEASLSEVNIYPNPTTTGTEINLQATCDKVEVFNALGVKVAEYHNVDSIDAFETAGIYVIRLTNNGDVKHCRLVVK